MAKGKKIMEFKRNLKNIMDKIRIVFLIPATFVILFATSINTENIKQDLLKSKGVKEKVLSYIDYSNMLKDLINNAPIVWIAFVVIIIIWILKAYFYFFYKEPIEGQKEFVHILGHSSLGKTQFKFNESFLEESQPEISEVNIVDRMKKIEGNYANLNYITNMQDDLIENFKSSINHNNRYGYMGIAHTPLVLRAGYKIGDEIRFALFHKKRNEDYYDELNNNEDYEKIQIEKIDMNDDSNELIVAISTSFQIDDSSLRIFEFSSKSLLKFNLENKGVDIIISYKQVDEYINYIQNKIKQVVAENNIKKVHMVISSSVAFTFTLGQSISENHDCETIVYHYDRNHPLLYPWGINLFNQANECLHIN